jgi:parallel beta-helix repeat protein
MRPAALAFALSLGIPVAASAAATQGGPLGVPLPLLPADNWWNTDVSQAPVDPKSATFVSFVGGSGRRLHPDFGGCADDPGTCHEIYGFPYVVVTGVQPADLRAVTFDYADESDGVDHNNNDAPVPFYPIPDAAKTGFRWIEGGGPGTDPRDSDRHMLIVDRDHNTLYELYNLGWNGTDWEGGSGAFFDMNTDNRRPEGWTSADAAGLAILPGLVRYDEVYGPDPIRHAFRVTVHDTNGHVFPASHDAGSRSGAPPMGARFRLKASKDITQCPNAGFPGDVCPPEMQKIFQAMKTYGLIVADNGSDMYISGTFDTNWNNDILNPAFGMLKASDFEVVKLGWQPPTSVLAVSNAVPVVEGNSGMIPAEFTVTLTPAFTDTVTVRYATAPDTATAGVDYVSKSGTLTFLPGATSATVDVSVRGDVLHEEDETFRLVLSNPVNALLGADTATATILDDDAPPALSIADAGGPEGDAGLTNRLFAVTLSTRGGAPVTVDYATADGTAVAGSDYVSTSGTLTFAPGVVKQVIAVPTLGDLVTEPDETFSVVLSNPTEASLARDTAAGTIVNDDALPSLSISDATVTEGTGATTTAVLPVTLSVASAETVTVRYATSAGTALAGSDYAARSGTLTFAPGATAASISVPVVPDSRVEKNEAFLVRLSSPRNAKLARAAGQVAILDDDGVADPCRPVLAVPITLDAPGSYCLARNVTTPMKTGVAITIAADGVDLDLEGFTLSGTGGLGTQALGIASNDRKNLTVHHGTVRGFLAGVTLRQAEPYPVAQGLVVSGVKVLSNTYSGIWVEGADNVVTQCTVTSTGRGTAFGPDHDAVGIAAVGPGIQIGGNIVTATTATGHGASFGVAATNADGADVGTNHVAAVRTRPTAGVFVDTSSSVTVHDNVFSNLAFGIVFAHGSTGTATGNTFTSVTTPQVGP